LQNRTKAKAKPEKAGSTHIQDFSKLLKNSSLGSSEDTSIRLSPKIHFGSMSRKSKKIRILHFFILIIMIIIHKKESFVLILNQRWRSVTSWYISFYPPPFVY
jgi:hypothetical protein